MPRKINKTPRFGDENDRRPQAIQLGPTGKATVNL